jgi:two-component system alkaline phosphatase synthesis response regulator PhoP
MTFDRQSIPRHSPLPFLCRTYQRRTSFTESIISMTEELRKKVLIVDDQPSMITTLRFQVQNAGYDFLTASNGEEALRVIDSDKPDLVMLDVMMPKMNGWEVCRTIRSNEATKHIPVFIITALHSDADSVNAKNSGANEFIVKPIKSADLAARLKKYLGSPFKV